MNIKKTASITASSALICGLLSMANSVPNAQAAGLPITITSPTNGTTINATTQTITGTTAPGTSVSLSIDGASPVIVTADGAGNWSYTASGLTNGNHTISASVVGDSYAYVPNGGGFGNPYISVINVSSNAITSTIAANGNISGGVAVNPTNSGSQKVYVTSGDQVSMIDPVSDTIASNVNAGAGPRNVAYNPAGSTAYVANFGTNGNSTVSIINPPSGSVYNGIIGNQAFGSSMNSAGTKLYVANYSSGTVSVLDKLGNIITSIAVGSNPVGVAADPFSSKMYVTNANSGTISVIDSTTDSVMSTFAVGSYPLGVVFHPSAPLAYVANGAGNSVSVISTTTDSVIAGPIAVGNNPFGIDIDPTGSKLYVANVFSGTVSVIDTLTNTVSDTINVGGLPYFIGRFITPAIKNVYAISFGINTASNNGGGTVSPTTSGSAFAFDSRDASNDHGQGSSQDTKSKTEEGKDSGEVKSAKTGAEGLIDSIVKNISNNWPWYLLPLAAVAIPFIWFLAKRRKKKEEESKPKKK